MIGKRGARRRFVRQTSTFGKCEVLGLCTDDRRLAPGQKSVRALSESSCSWLSLSESKCHRGQNLELSKFDEANRGPRPQFWQECDILTFALCSADLLRPRCSEDKGSKGWRFRIRLQSPNDQTRLESRMLKAEAMLGFYGCKTRGSKTRK